MKELLPETWEGLTENTRDGEPPREQEQQKFFQS